MKALKNTIPAANERIAYVRLLRIIAVMLIPAASIFYFGRFAFEAYPVKTLEIYLKHLAGKDILISRVLGQVDIACSIGPYEDFRDPRFAAVLSDIQINAAQNELGKERKQDHGDRSFFMIGFRGDEIVSVYDSYYFHDGLMEVKKSYKAVGCIKGDGWINIVNINSRKIISLVPLS